MDTGALTEEAAEAGEGSGDAPRSEAGEGGGDALPTEDGEAGGDAPRSKRSLKREAKQQRWEAKRGV